MIQPLSVPPAIAVGALYDSVLQSALRQFFERASLDTEVTPSVSSDGRLSIEPSANPSALIIRWFGTRYTLRVPPRVLRFSTARMSASMAACSGSPRATLAACSARMRGLSACTMYGCARTCST